MKYQLLPTFLLVIHAVVAAYCAQPNISDLGSLAHHQYAHPSQDHALHAHTSGKSKDTPKPPLDMAYIGRARPLMGQSGDVARRSSIEFSEVETGRKQQSKDNFRLPAKLALLGQYASPSAHDKNMFRRDRDETQNTVLITRMLPSSKRPDLELQLMSLYEEPSHIESFIDEQTTTQGKVDTNLFFWKSQVQLKIAKLEQAIIHQSHQNNGSPKASEKTPLITPDNEASTSRNQATRNVKHNVPQTQQHQSFDIEQGFPKHGLRKQSINKTHKSMMEYVGDRAKKLRKVAYDKPGTVIAGTVSTAGSITAAVGSGMAGYHVGAIGGGVSAGSSVLSTAAELHKGIKDEDARERGSPRSSSSSSGPRKRHLGDSSFAIGTGRVGGSEFRHFANKYLIPQDRRYAQSQPVELVPRMLDSTQDKLNRLANLQEHCKLLEGSIQKHNHLLWEKGGHESDASKRPGVDTLLAEERDMQEKRQQILAEIDKLKSELHINQSQSYPGAKENPLPQTDSPLKKDTGKEQQHQGTFNKQGSLREQDTTNSRNSRKRKPTANMLVDGARKTRKVGQKALEAAWTKPHPVMTGATQTVGSLLNAIGSGSKGNFIGATGSAITCATNAAGTCLEIHKAINEPNVQKKGSPQDSPQSSHGSPRRSNTGSMVRRRNLAVTGSASIVRRDLAPRGHVAGAFSVKLKMRLRRQTMGG